MKVFSFLNQPFFSHHSFRKSLRSFLISALNFSPRGGAAAASSSPAKFTTLASVDISLPYYMVALKCIRIFQNSLKKKPCQLPLLASNRQKKGNVEKVVHSSRSMSYSKLSWSIWRGTHFFRRKSDVSLWFYLIYNGILLVRKIVFFMHRIVFNDSHIMFSWWIGLLNFNLTTIIK